ncbi:MAG: hypothetical protein AUK03_16190 [Anaerolineae bacterium CG2_30_64_16]|nr:MAG: hypothetical protein AUK03_16190 [Anaerolineae bacterium CG2_30_64_16]
MADKNYTEKDEKLEKQEEKEEKEEKSWDEKWRRDPLSAVVWALILIWAGLVLLADTTGLLARFELIDTWGVIFLGAGVLLLLEAAARFLLPEYRRPIMGTVIFGLILIAIGLGDLVSWGIIWAIALIAIGAILLVGGVFRRR